MLGDNAGKHVAVDHRQDAVWNFAPVQGPDYKFKANFEQVPRTPPFILAAQWKQGCHIGAQ